MKFHSNNFNSFSRNYVPKTIMLIRREMIKINIFSYIMGSLENTTVTSGQISWQWSGCRALPSYHWSYSCSCLALISTHTCEPSFSTPNSSSCRNWSLSYRQLDQLTLKPEGHTNCLHRTRLDVWIPR